MDREADSKRQAQANIQATNSDIVVPELVVPDHVVEVGVSGPHDMSASRSVLSYAYNCNYI